METKGDKMEMKTEKENEMNEIVKVDMSQYGLDETKAAAVKKDFDAVLKIAVELEDEYNRIVALPITEETCKAAKQTRLKYVKVRTGIAAVHKERKAFYLSGGRAIDGLKNAYTHAVEGNEAKLKEIECYFENQEKARIEKLEADRLAEAEQYDTQARMMRLGEMSEDVWNSYISSAKLAHQKRIELEQEAEAARVAKEKAEAEERERIRQENEKLKAEAEERKAEEAKKQAAHEAELKAEREAREKIERDAREKAEAERKEKEQADKLARNKAHQTKINREVLSGLVAAGLDEDQAKTVIRAIVSGKIDHVSIQY